MTAYLKKYIWVFISIPVITALPQTPHLLSVRGVLSAILFSLISATFAFGVCVLFCKLNTVRKIIMCTIIVAADQGLKILMYVSQFQFRPHNYVISISISENHSQNGVLNFLGIIPTAGIAIALKITLLAVLIIVFVLLNKKYKVAAMGCILMLPVGICTLSDSLFWGYTLDYVGFYRLYVYDLKDFISDAGAGLLLIGVLDVYFEERKKKNLNRK
jgi:hypothetical protein